MYDFGKSSFEVIKALLQNEEDKSALQKGKIVHFFLQYTEDTLIQTFSGILYMEILESDCSSKNCL